MANQIVLLDIAAVKLFLQTQTLDSRYHTWHFNVNSFYDSQLYFQERKIYCQKWQTNENIYVQLASNFGPVTARLIDAEENIIAPAVVTTLSQSFYFTPFAAYGITVNLAGITAGIYWLQVLVGGTGTETKLISEPMMIAEDWPGTIQFEYSHSENEYGAIFQNGEKMYFRTEGVIDDFTPGITETVFEDDPGNIVRLSSTTHRSFKLSIGNEAGVPDWVADKVNRIFGCDSVLLDGKQFVRPEGGKMEPKGEEGYPMRGWKMDIREAKNRNGLTIENDIPQNNSVVLIYIGENALFGLTGDSYITKVE